MNNQPKKEKKEKNQLEEGAVSIVTGVVSISVGMVTRRIIQTAIKEVAEKNVTTKVLFIIGELAISGAVSSVITSKYEQSIREMFSRYNRIVETTKEEKEEKEGKN